VLPKKPEPTIFSIGTKAYFENPTSDILAFYLDPIKPHGFGANVLEALLWCADQCLTNKLTLARTTHRELTTDTGSRIDIVIEGNDWVVAIENKIHATESNPFDEYTGHLERTYATKKILTILLSARPGEDIGAWKRITYKEFLDSVRKRVPTSMLEDSANKWAIFFRDFLLSLETEATLMEIEPSQTDFVEQHYGTIVQLCELVESYHKHLIDEATMNLTSALLNVKVRSKVEQWDAGPALRFYMDSWPSESNITLVVGSKETGLDFWLQAYAYIADQSIKTGELTFAPNLEYWTETRGSWRCWRTIGKWSSRADVLRELGKLAVVFNQFLLEMPPI